MKKFLAILMAAVGLGGPAQSATPDVRGNAQASHDLRAMVFALTPSEIGLSPENHAGRVWGMVMETGIDGGFYTLVVLGDGGTSLYYSNGGGIIGAGEHASVRSEGAKYLALAEKSLSESSATASHSPPLPGQTVFYFLTFDGLKSYSAREIELVEERDRLSELFHGAHAVIARIREASGE